jgi:nucleotide-binding universal stress UspA family protein
MRVALGEGIMFRRILLAYNGSEHSNAALRHAADIARLADCELHMLGIVISTGSFALAQSNSSFDLIEKERQHIQRALETAATKLREEGTSVTFSIREGEPAAQIILQAHSIAADLVVLGNTNKGIIARWLQGSLGEKLLSNLPCSLLIVTKDRRAG